MSVTIPRQPYLGQPHLVGLYAPIAAELADAEAIFKNVLHNDDLYVQQLVEHCSGFQGKRLRPALLLLTGRAVGPLVRAHTVFAAVLEMVHTASLVHDDVLDEAMVRRHAATINAEWGNETAVLLGDYLFTHAFHLAASIGSAESSEWIGRATNQVCLGEMRQVSQRGNIDLEEASYLEIIRGKTAELLAVCSLLGAYHAGAEPAVYSALEEFGRNLGLAFQISDDLLDLWGEERSTGKTLGTDLAKQKMTLPLIWFLRNAPAGQAADMRHLLSSSRPDRRWVRSALESAGAFDYAWDRARYYARLAEDALMILPASPSREVLQTICQGVVDRTN